MKNEYIDNLKRRVAELERENLILKEKLAFYERYPNISVGLQGETIISKLVSGQLTSFNAPHDIETKTGLKIEVKYSSLGLANRKNTVTTKRWVWKSVFGGNGKKEYDHLILIGDCDDRFQDQYLDTKSPYVIFDMPYNEVMDLSTKSQYNQRQIILLSNPQKARSISKALYSKYQIIAEDLSTRYGF